MTRPHPKASNVVQLHGKATPLMAEAARIRTEAGKALDERKYETARKLNLRADRKKYRAQRMMAERGRR